MQQLELGYGVYGWRSIRRYANRMETLTPEAVKRLAALKFWDKHGLPAALDFYKVSRRTLFRWKQLYQDSSTQAVSLNNLSRTPRRRRVRSWPAEVMTRLRELRQSYPSLGAEKLQLFLADWCEPRKLPCPKVRTLLRLIAERPELKKARPPQGFCHAPQSCSPAQTQRVQSQLPRSMCRCGHHRDTARRAAALHQHLYRHQQPLCLGGRFHPQKQQARTGVVATLKSLLPLSD